MILEDQTCGTKILKDRRITCNEGTGGVEVHLHPFLPPGKSPCTHCARGGPSGRSGRARIISPSPEFDPGPSSQ
jgi:hypothetical protein